MYRTSCYGLDMRRDSPRAKRYLALCATATPPLELAPWRVEEWSHAGLEPDDTWPSGRIVGFYRALSELSRPRRPKDQVALALLGRGFITKRCLDFFRREWAEDANPPAVDAANFEQDGVATGYVAEGLDLECGARINRVVQKALNDRADKAAAALDRDRTDIQESIMVSVVDASLTGEHMDEDLIEEFTGVRSATSLSALAAFTRYGPGIIRRVIDDHPEKLAEIAVMISSVLDAGLFPSLAGQRSGDDGDNDDAQLRCRVELRRRTEIDTMTGRFAPNLTVLVLFMMAAAMSTDDDPKQLADRAEQLLKEDRPRLDLIQAVAESVSLAAPPDQP